MSTPLLQPVDVIIPVYNGQDFIISAIKSVEQQTYKPEKIIIVNDGSTDDTEKEVLNYKDSCTISIIYLYQENTGPNAARNAGIKASSSPLLAFLDADDVWMPEKLERQVGLFSDESVGLVYADYEVVDGSGLVINSKKTLLDKAAKGNVFEKVLEANIITGSASAVVIPKQVFEVVGYFDEALYFGEDWDMWIRIAKEYKIDFVDEVLVQIRRHTKNTTSNSYNRFSGELLFYKKWIPLVTNVPEAWSNRLALKVIYRLPKTDFLKVFIDTLPKPIREQLLPNLFHSVFLYGIRGMFYYAKGLFLKK